MSLSSPASDTTPTHDEVSTANTPLNNAFDPSSKRNSNFQREPGRRNEFESKDEDEEEEYIAVNDDANEGIFYSFEAQEKQQQITVNKFEKDLHNNNNNNNNDNNNNHNNANNNSINVIQTANTLDTFCAMDEDIDISIDQNANANANPNAIASPASNYDSKDDSESDDGDNEQDLQRFLSGNNNPSANSHHNRNNNNNNNDLEFDDNDEDAIPAGIQESALILDWSEDDEIREEYESDTNDANHNNNHNNGEDADIDVEDGNGAINNTNTNTNTNSNKNNSRKRPDITEKIAWFPTQTLQTTESMKYNQAAYTVLHQFNTEWPCMSFDFIPDQLGAVRTTVPFSLYLVTGTQADPNYRREANNQTNTNTNGHGNHHGSANTQIGNESSFMQRLRQKRNHLRIQNKIQFLKLSDLQKTKYDDDDDGINEEMDKEYAKITDDNALLQNRSICHPSVINRIRICKAGGINNQRFVGLMSEDQKMYIYNGKQHILSLDGLCTDIELCHENVLPLFESKFIDEGFAIAWSKFDEGWVVCGSCAGELRLYKPHTCGFKRDLQFKTLKASIEDIEWSPNDRNVFASVGVDKCIRVWDQRTQARKEHVSRVSNAHKLDINVLSWNPHPGHEHLLLTGSDDHSFKVWDLRKMHHHQQPVFAKKLKRCKYHYMSKWHLKPITSIEWHPFDSSTAIVSSEDNQITIWDFSLEEDNTIPNTGAPLPQGCKLPPQLTFVHGGQQDIKEVHWHPQIPNLILSTAGSGFHCLQPDNLMEAFNAQFENMSIAELPETDPFVPSV